MQGPVHDAASAHHASVALRIGGAIFAACPDDLLQSLYYRLDGGLSAVWRHLRGSEIHPGVVRAAEEANRVLGTQARALRLPEEFLRGYQCLAGAALARFTRHEAGTRDETGARAVEAVGFLEAGVDGAEGAVAFERSCQAATDSLLEGWAVDPLSTVRAVRRETGVWALAYQRFVTPEAVTDPDTAD
ncbi:hypothetical protein ACIQUX_13535 [Streptomyces sp. NPDC101133]|uniref:hypothetical protein n=1 Tax=Streptomyces sp. NPDC101133 TaxID=3366111 RepID=UPI0037FAC40E